MPKQQYLGMVIKNPHKDLNCADFYKISQICTRPFEGFRQNNHLIIYNF